MIPRLLIPLFSLAAFAGLSACANPQAAGVSRGEVAFEPVYQGVDTRLLEGDLVNFQVIMTGARDERDGRRSMCEWGVAGTLLV